MGRRKATIYALSEHLWGTHQAPGSTTSTAKRKRGSVVHFNTYLENEGCDTWL